MAFLKRLGFYLIGLSIGLIFLFFFLKKKSEETGASFCYLPNCRVIKDLRSKPLKFSPEFRATHSESLADSVKIDSFLMDGTVDFDISETKSKPCKTYRIRGFYNEYECLLVVYNCPDEVVVKDLSPVPPPPE